MMKKLLAIALFGITLISSAQTLPGSLKGVVRDKVTKETVPSALVQVKLGEEVMYQTLTDFDGRFNISPVDPADYTVVFSSLGYKNQTYSNVTVSPGRAKVLDAQLGTESTELQTIDLSASGKIIEKGKTSTVKKAEDITNLPIRGTQGIAAITPGVKVGDDGQMRFRGARDGTNQIFIDGVKVRGDANIPREAIAQQEVITGGLPANYGDVTGGVISTTTKNPLPYFFGGAELVTSSPFNFAADKGYHYNLLGLTLGGPLWKKEVNGAQKTIIGFLLAGEIQYDNDARPTRYALPYLQDDVRADLEKNPLRPSSVGLGTLSNAEFLTDDQLETRWVRENSDRFQTRLTGNIKIVTGKNTTLSVGGRYNYSKLNAYNFGGMLMNYDQNLEYIDQDWAVFGRFQQRFPSNDSALFKNVFYTIQVDYSRNSDIRQHAVHKDNFFHYGHVGSFESQKTRLYVPGTDTATGLSGWILSTYVDTAVKYRPSTYNPIRSNYTTQYYGFVNDGVIQNQTNNLQNIQQGGGLINGQNPNNVHGLWTNVGAMPSLGYNNVNANYIKQLNSQFRLTANSTFNIKDHALIVGVEFEQRVDRGFGVNANQIWEQMRLLQNDAIRELDIANPYPVYDANGVYQDTVNYDRLFDASKPRTFDRNLRTTLGMNPNGKDWLDIDSYDPNIYNLNMFSANELLNVGGRQYVTYYGYDYTGNILDGRPTLEDFYRTDDQGNSDRQIAAFEPIYMAGFIQDQFTFNDLFFNLGVRVDRFDANQSVLADPFVLYPTYKVGDIGSTGTDIDGAEVPGSVGSDYVVYVNDLNDPTKIVGYRSGNTWYNAEGDIEANPKNIADLSGGIKPFLKYPDQQNLSETVNESFVDYTPQVTVSPRVAFQFPITDEAEFFAHYDLLVRRPDPGLNRMDPISYLLLENGTAGFLTNPDLKPQRTTDYEIGFRQMLTDNSALKISAFYREMRDMMQTVSLNEAYPMTYITYGNQDFGTVKGFTFEFDLRRTRESNYHDGKLYLTVCRWFRFRSELRCQHRTFRPTEPALHPSS